MAQRRQTTSRSGILHRSDGTTGRDDLTGRTKLTVTPQRCWSPVLLSGGKIPTSSLQFGHVRGATPASRVDTYRVHPEPVLPAPSYSKVADRTAAGRFVCSRGSVPVTYDSRRGSRLHNPNSISTEPRTQSSAVDIAVGRSVTIRHCSGQKRPRNENTASTNSAPLHGFSAALSRETSPLPASLQKRLAVVQHNSALGKVRVLLRVPTLDAGQGYFSVDVRRRQMTVFPPTSVTSHSQQKTATTAAPKMFAFDGIFDNKTPQCDVSGSALPDVIDSVLNGSDGCVLSLGQGNAGGSYSMLGDATSVDRLGVIPTAISWLYRAISDHRQRSAARFSVRVSAMEIQTQTDSSHDLLSVYSKDCADHQSSSAEGSGQPQRVCEVRAETAEKAGHYLDVALKSRRGGSTTDGSGGCPTHLLFTLHVFQYSVNPQNNATVSGGRARLHLYDLGNFDKEKPFGLSLSAVGNALVSIFNNHKHLPCRNSKLVQLFGESMGSLMCQTTVLIHVSTDPVLYNETLTTIQLASRIHRMRRRRIKPNGSSGSGGSAEDTHLTRLRVLGPGEESSGRSSSDVDPSSSEQSADTVIYLGPGADEATDGEHPPVHIPSLNSGDNRPTISRTQNGARLTLERSGNNCRPTSTHSTPTHRPNVPIHKLADSQRKSGAGRKQLPAVGSPKNRRRGDWRHITSGSDRPASAPLTSESTAQEERWIDGPRVSRSRLTDVRRLQQQPLGETWIDGPSPASQERAPEGPPTNSRNGPEAALQHPLYGFMDEHKQSMISRWVEHQSGVVVKRRMSQIDTELCSDQSSNTFRGLTHFKTAPAPDSTEPKILTRFKTDGDVNVPNTTKQQGINQDADNGKATKSTDVDAGPEKTQDENIVADTSQRKRQTEVPISEPRTTLAGNSCTLRPADDCTNSGEQTRAVSSRGSSEGSLPDERRTADASQNTDDAVSTSENSDMGPQRPSSSSSSDVARGEIIEVEERDEPVLMIDCCLQVTEEDIAACLGVSQLPMCHDTGEHPLRVLSEENLTFASTLSDMYTLGDESDCDPLSEIHINDSHQLRLLDIPDYNQLCKDLSLTNQRLDSITRLQQFYQELAAGSITPAPDRTTYTEQLVASCNPLVYTDTQSICSEPIRPTVLQRRETPQQSDDDGHHGNYVRSIKDWLALVPDRQGSNGLQGNYKEHNGTIGSKEDFDIQSDITPYISTFSCRSSLRHPDGASNPSLHRIGGPGEDRQSPTAVNCPALNPVDDDQLQLRAQSVTTKDQPTVTWSNALLEQRSPGNGASGSDDDTMPVNVISMQAHSSRTCAVVPTIQNGKPRTEAAVSGKSKKSRLGRFFRRTRSCPRNAADTSAPSECVTSANSAEPKGNGSKHPVKRVSPTNVGGYDSGTDSGISLSKNSPRSGGDSRSLRFRLDASGNDRTSGSACSERLVNGYERSPVHRLNQHEPAAAPSSHRLSYSAEKSCSSKDEEIQAGSPAHKCGSCRGGSHGLFPSKDSIEGTAPACMSPSKKSWSSSGIPIISRLWRQKPQKRAEPAV